MESEWKLKLTPLARTDLEEIYQYISICLDAPQAADRLMTAFEKSFEQLQNHPFSFPRAYDESIKKKRLSNWKNQQRVFIKNGLLN